MDQAKILFIAMACHEANKRWCEANGDETQSHWETAEQWQRDSAIKGVEFRINNPNAGEDSQHNAWMADKINDGWVWGETKDFGLKTHPCIVPFNRLSAFQQKKDRLFCAIVDVLKDAIPAENKILSFGQEAVGASFNPSNMPEVDKCKQLFADAIDQMNDLRNASESGGQKRHASAAITDIETAQMRAVKALTWRGK